MASVLLVLACAVAVAFGQSTVLSCTNSYTSGMQSASGAEKCTVLDNFGACLSSVLTGMN